MIGVNSNLSFGVCTEETGSVTSFLLSHVPDASWLRNVLIIITIMIVIISAGWRLLCASSGPIAANTRL